MPSIISAGTTTGTALSLTGDTSGELQIKTNNGSTTAMTIDSSGKALIGTTSALSVAGINGKLQVVSSDSTASINVVRTSDAPSYLSFGSGSSGTNVVNNGQLGIINWTGFHTAAYSSAAQIAAEVDGTPGATNDMPGRLVFRTSADGSSSPTERMRIDSSGRLGIGTSSPSTRLTINAAYTSARGQVSIVGASDEAAITFYNNSTFHGLVNFNDSFGYLGTASNTPLFFTTNNAERMRIDSSGNVGIGTASPLCRLDVVSPSGTFQRVRSADGTGTATLYQNSDTGTTTGDGLYIGMGNDEIGYLYHYENQPLVFGTNNTERMRINSTGQLLVNATTDAAGAGARLHITGNTSQTACSVRIGTDGTPGWYFANAAGTKVGDIVINSGGTAYNTTSDYRLKENVAPMTGALARVSALKPVTYKWKADGSAGEGFIAHELQEVCPLAVTGEKDAVNEDGSIKSQGIDTSSLVATLTAAIQEQQALITDLTTRLTALENK